MKVEVINNEIIVHVTGDSVYSLFSGRLKHELSNLDTSEIEVVQINIMVPYSIKLHLHLEEEIRDIFNKIMEVRVKLRGNSTGGKNQLSVELTCSGIETVIISDFVKSITIHSGSNIKNLHIFSDINDIRIFGFVTYLHLFQGIRVEGLYVEQGGRIDRIKTDEKNPPTLVYLIMISEFCRIGTIERIKVDNVSIPVNISRLHELEWFIPEDDSWNLDSNWVDGLIFVNNHSVPCGFVRGIKRPDWLWLSQN